MMLSIPWPAWLAGAALGAIATQAIADGPAACSVRSGATVPTIVELYTSEGCSSCPPADQWLSRLKAADPQAHAFAFHVDYWDYIGWKDRFAHPVLSQRQGQQLAVNGSAYRYTPQVVRNGADERRWSALSLPLPAPAAGSSVDVTLARDGDRFTALVTPLPGAPARLSAWWAVTEHGHVSAVKAGENQGETLKHDFVVREYRPVSAWPASAGAASTLQFAPSVPGDAAHPRQVSLVVVDGSTGKPLQAVRLGC
jgi:hypothetical protein